MLIPEILISAEIVLSILFIYYKFNNVGKLFNVLRETDNVAVVSVSTISSKKKAIMMIIMRVLRMALDITALYFLFIYKDIATFGICLSLCASAYMIYNFDRILYFIHVLIKQERVVDSYYMETICDYNIYLKAKTYESKKGIDILNSLSFAKLNKIAIPYTRDILPRSVITKEEFNKMLELKEKETV